MTGLDWAIGRVNTRLRLVPGVLPPVQCRETTQEGVAEVRRVWALQFIGQWDSGTVRHGDRRRPARTTSAKWATLQRAKGNPISLRQ